MEQSGNAAIRRRLLQWTINATLLLSVLTFSGNVPQSKSFSFEATKTELKQTNWTDCERTVRFTNVHDISGHHKFFDQPKNFCSSLFQYERLIAVKLKDKGGNCPIDDKQFLIHFFNYNPEESDSDRSRG